jgi:hypothetical protein
MKKLIFVVITVMLFSLSISNIAFPELANIQVGKGTLKIGGILQAGFTYYVEDETGFDSFTLNRARFLFWGVIVPDKVKYFVQLDHKGSISVLDYKAQFFYIPQTEIAFGRFLPNFTLYMPYSTAKLEMINYPLTTLRFAVWRQVGIQSTTKTDYVDFNLGVFNGYPANNFSDDNDAKDFLARADFKPPLEQATVRVGGYAWVGSASPPAYVPNADEETLEMNRFGGFATVDYENQIALRFRGEFLMASTEYVEAATASGAGSQIENVCCVDAQAYFAHVGIKPDPKWEILARYDFHDPDTDVDENAESWITGGVNYYLEGINSMFYLNYIHKMEEGEEVDNDLVQGQVQITF